jgi:hypothetical protein
MLPENLTAPLEYLSCTKPGSAISMVLEEKRNFSQSTAGPRKRNPHPLTEEPTHPLTR